MTTRLFVIDDSTSFRKMITSYLRLQGYAVFEAWSLTSARKLLPSVRPSIILLDLQLEDGEGYSLLSDQARPDASTIVISSREHAADRVRSLELGAEDYIVKPVELCELLVRIRRVEMLMSCAHGASYIDYGSFLLDHAQRRAIHPSGEDATLSRSEYALLRLFLDSGDGIVTRAAISQRVLGVQLAQGSRAVDVLVSKLRRKLDPTGRSSPIWSVRGQGYRFTAKADRNARAYKIEREFA